MSKHKGGLGFRSLYGFNIALISKQCWKFMKEPNSLVARVFKARYYPNCDFMQARIQTESSFIWNGIMTARDTLKNGYRWVIGNGRNINAVQDPWLKGKEGFRVDQNRDYGISNIHVSEFITPGTNAWNTDKVLQLFSQDDAKLILSSRIPHGNVHDRVAWSRSNNGQYTVKTGYQYWCDNNLVSTSVAQASGWSKLWILDIPHNVKIFLWRFCRNNIPVRKRFRAKGVTLPIICPMCESYIEHKLHIFFDCPFAASCWNYVGVSYDMSMMENALDWLLQKLSSGSKEETMLIAKVFWGIWFFRNKKVWDNKVVNNGIAMDWSTRYFLDWEAARVSRTASTTVNIQACPPTNHKWKPPKMGTYKLNTDATFRSGDDTSFIGLVLRDHLGTFIAGKVQKVSMIHSVFEAKANAINEGLHWLSTLPYQHVEIESDSLLSVQTLKRPNDNFLEVGFVLEDQSRPGLSISFAKRQANKAAHLMAKLPCLLKSQRFYMSPPNVLLETLMYDSSF